MSTETIEIPTGQHSGIKLPPLGTMLPHLGGAFWALQRAKPGSGQADYAIIVPHGPEFELRKVAWGGAGKEEPGAACQWDGLANTQALLANADEHPVVAPLVQGIGGLTDLYIPSLREMHNLAANGCDAFDPDLWYWTSTQYSRGSAWGQYFYDGLTDSNGKSWSGGAARFVRRSALELLIP
ncbi:MAG: hypothetical protein A2Z93_14350 [Curvibacter sp. GWA2_64_110]|nr:MAG: hypothetical protein A2Z93_14350 [Curvibacter sp. GWA2_64_110]